MQSIQNLNQNAAPVYSSGLSRLPRPLLIEPMEVDAALAKLLGESPLHASSRPTVKVPASGSRQVKQASTEVDWDGNWDGNWAQDDMSGVEVTEHLLPEGLDFAAFHALLRLAH